MLDHLAEDVFQFGDLRFIDVSPFEQSNYIKKKFIRMKSSRKLSTVEEAVEAVDMFSDAEGDAVPNILMTSRTQHSRYGVKASLELFIPRTTSNFGHLTLDTINDLFPNVMGL